MVARLESSVRVDHIWPLQCNTMIVREFEVTLASPPPPPLFFPLKEVKVSRIDAVKEPCYVSP
jgi:hypothetical protein